MSHQTLWFISLRQIILLQQVFYFNLLEKHVIVNNSSLRVELHASEDVRFVSPNRFKTSDYMQGIVGSYRRIMSSIFRGRNFDSPKSTESNYIPRILYEVFFRYRSLKEVRKLCLVEKRKVPKGSVSVLTAHPTVLAYLTAHLPTD